jgi:CMP-N,N'-diacetyllegionaminic acid synthase
MKVAVIPARAGSTRLKNKNIYPLGGKPLIRWTVEAVVESGVFDKIVVSTDGDDIYEAVSDLPVERHVRPDHHATVTATALNAMLDYMASIALPRGEQQNIFAYFLPTCPFILPEDIQKGMSMLTEECDAVVSMTEMSDTVQLACVMKNGWTIPVFDNLELGMTNSKFIKKYYKPSGAFYMGWWDKILENKNFFKGNVKGILLPPERAVDINNIQDMKYAESVIRLDD